MPTAEGPEEHAGGAQTPRRRRRAVGPPGATPAVDGPSPVWSPEPVPAEDDDERFLRDVPPHHGG